MARRTTILDLLVTELKKINKTTTSASTVPRSPYTFKHNVSNNVYKNFKFLDDINDYPTICFIVGSEGRTHIGGGIKYGNLELTIRGYVKDDNVLDAADDLIDDIEYIVNSLGFITEGCNIVEARITSVGTDEGLFYPFGIVDIEALIIYQLDEVIV